MSQAAVYLLPPKARAIDWPLAGACAGLVLTLVEFLVAAAGRTGLTPPIALMLASGNVLLVTLPCVAIGAVQGALGLRAPHSVLVLGVVGPLLFAAIAGSLLAKGGAGAFATALALALGIGALSAGIAWLGDRAERAGVAASGPFVWGATAVLLVGSAQTSEGTGSFWSLIFAALVLVGGTIVAHEVVKRRGGGGRMRFGNMLLLLAVSTLLIATHALWMPWLLVNSESRSRTTSRVTRANVLVLTVPEGDTAARFAALAVDSVDRPGEDLDALLRSAEGGWIAASLGRSGYTTGAIARDPRLARRRGASDFDARLGGLALLRGPASWMASAALVAKKGVDTLLDALARLPSDLHWRYVHIGKGSEADLVYKKAEELGLGDRIDWRGAKAQAEVIAAYRAADLYVMASRIAEDGDRDGLPNVLMEAGSQELAAVTTAVSAVPELITDGENGLLVPPDDPAALATALEALIRDPKQRLLMGQNARRIVLDRFAMDPGLDALAARIRDEIDAAAREAA